VTSVTIGEETFDPNRSNVFSTGTYRAQDGIVSGFGRGDVLNSNGFFSFVSPRTTTEITVEAGGSQANFDILVDDAVLGSFTADPIGRVPPWK